MKFLYPVILTLIVMCAHAQNKTSIGNDHILPDEYKNYSLATFAAGNFWNEEALFESINGVKEAVCGYAGGTVENPTYELVETGKSGYAESVMVYYDPKVVAYATLVEVFFASQNPAKARVQGNDYGSQYRSIAFFRTPFEKQVIDNQIRAVNLSGKYKMPVVTQVVQYTKFWVAEDYHQNYIEKNMNKSAVDYIHVVSIPAIKKFQQQYPQLIKPDHIF